MGLERRRPRIPVVNEPPAHAVAVPATDEAIAELMADLAERRRIDGPPNGVHPVLRSDAMELPAEQIGALSTHGHEATSATGLGIHNSQLSPAGTSASHAVVEEPSATIVLSTYRPIQDQFNANAKSADFFRILFNFFNHF